MLPGDILQSQCEKYWVRRRKKIQYYITQLKSLYRLYLRSEEDVEVGAID